MSPDMTHTNYMLNMHLDIWIPGSTPRNIYINGLDDLQPGHQGLYPMSTPNPKGL